MIFRTTLHYHVVQIEEAKLFRAQGQSNEEVLDVYRLIGKWLAETRSSNSRTILEKYLKPAVSIAEDVKSTDKKAMEKKCHTHFHLAHYTDALFRSHEEILDSNGGRIKEQNVAKFISTLAG